MAHLFFARQVRNMCDILNRNSSEEVANVYMLGDVLTSVIEHDDVSGQCMTRDGVIYGWSRGKFSVIRNGRLYICAVPTIYEFCMGAHVKQMQLLYKLRVAGMVAAGILHTRDAQVVGIGDDSITIKMLGADGDEQRLIASELNSDGFTELLRHYMLSYNF